ncbi:MAG: sodium:solute symporter family protein, partial [Elusimicrobiaceae bacterium]|nr:sodium:solute symporter family protein [Elusimicrobiaceae bacterium]
KNHVLANQIFFFLIGGLSILLALFFGGSFKKIWLVLGSYMAACLLIPMMIGYFFPKKISDKQFSFSVWFSALIVTVWNFLPRTSFWAEIEGFYIGLIVNIIFLGSILIGKRNEIK